MFFSDARQFKQAQLPKLFYSQYYKVIKDRLNKCEEDKTKKREVLLETGKSCIAEELVCAITLGGFVELN